MTELTGIDANTQEIKCYDQLSSSNCKTDLCPLKQLLEDNDRSHDLHYGDIEVELHFAGEDSIMTEKHVEIPNGETRYLSVVSEQIMDHSWEPGAIFQSFKDLTGMKQYQDSQPENEDLQTE